jgi:hypothetical protein
VAESLRKRAAIGMRAEEVVRALRARHHVVAEQHDPWLISRNLGEFANTFNTRHV